MKLNLGCGTNLREDYINIDIIELDKIPKGYEFRKMDAQNLGSFFDMTVDEIRADFLLEHFNLPQAQDFLYQCWRVLKRDGQLNLLVPDFENIANKVLGNKDNYEINFYAACYLLNTFVSAVCSDSSSPHKSMWTKDFL